MAGTCRNTGTPKRLFWERVPKFRSHSKSEPCPTELLDKGHRLCKSSCSWPSAPSATGAGTWMSHLSSARVPRLRCHLKKSCLPTYGSKVSKYVAYKATASEMLLWVCVSPPPSRGRNSVQDYSPNAHTYPEKALNPSVRGLIQKIEAAPFSRCSLSQNLLSCVDKHASSLSAPANLDS